MKITLTHAIVGFTAALTTLGVGNTAMVFAAANDAPPSNDCADVWVVGNTIPMDYTSCELEDGTEFVDPFGHRVCFGDMDGTNWLRSPDLQTAARIGGPVLEGEDLARLNAECLGMGDWLFDTETVNA